jgi:SAM-dependent methyltransferase
MKRALTNVDVYGEHRAAGIKRVMDAVKRNQIQILGKSIVDLGCNDGALSFEYLQKGAVRVIGVDIDEQAIRRARSRYCDERLVFVRNSVDSIPLSDNSCDIVISYDVFEHISQPRSILKELYRILVPNGKVLIGTWGWYHPFAPHLWSVMPIPWAHVLFSERTLLKVCQRVYHSPWYLPNMHDYDESGNRLADKYTQRTISTDHLNKLLIRDFERSFRSEGFWCETRPVPFGSRFANWTRVFLPIPWVREFVSGYVWFVLTRPE